LKYLQGEPILSRHVGVATVCCCRGARELR
jgi:hypothetical protein